jgi:heme-degrading monooxygenase HmoA
MIGVHMIQEIQPEHVEIYLRWRQAESELSLTAPGFIRRELFRDTEKPNVFYYVVFWESQEAIEAFTATPEFKAIASTSGMQEVMAAGRTERSIISEVFTVAASK